MKERHTTAAQLERAKATPGHPFIVGCQLAGVEPTMRQLHHWHQGRGVALAAAWKKWPRSKNLPRMRNMEQAERDA